MSHCAQKTRDRSSLVGRYAVPKFAGPACSWLLLSGALSLSAFAQPPDDPAPDAAAEQPADVEAADELPADLPRVPETQVVGQPQGESLPGNQTVQTPTRTEGLLSETGSSVTVITGDEIRERGQTSVAEVLRGVPGLDVVNQGGPGRVTSVFLRGASSEQTKVLIDGIPMNDPITPGRSFDFSTLSVDNIERIEILRGPQSTLYGSEAIGGVIQIFTKRGRGPLTGRAGAQGGAFGTAQEFGSFSYGNGLWYVSGGGSYFDTNGFSSADSRLAGNHEDDGFRLGTWSHRLGWTPFDNFDVDTILRYNNATTQIDDGGGPFQDDPNQKNLAEQTFVGVRFHYENLPGWWEQSLLLSTSDHKRSNYDPTDFLHPDDSFFSQFNSQLRMLDWQHNFYLTEWNTLTVGLVDQNESGSSSFFGTSIFGPFDGVSGEQTLRDTAVYAQDQVRVGDRWFTTFGARQDHYSQAGTANTYRVTTLYRLPVTETGFRGSIGTGFKAPTLFQLYDAFSGNLGLLPEESRGWDCGLDQPLFGGRMVMGATYFRNDFANLIDFNQQTFQYFNVGAAKATGVETQILWNVTSVTSFTLFYTRTDTEDLATNLQLLRRPHDKYRFMVNRSLFGGRGNVNFNLLYVGTRADADFVQFPPQRVTLNEYVTAYVSGSYKLTNNVEVFGRIDNLFNEKYQEAFGFGTAGTSAYAGGALTW